MDASKILIIGSGGQLGKALKSNYPDAQSTGKDDMDITSSDLIASYDWSNVRIILNAAAYSDVDTAETSGGRLAAWDINARAVANLARAAATHNIIFVHISTDYVFDGSNDPHTEDELFSPLNVYGQSKAAGDLAASLVPKHYVLRTSWLIGDGSNFVRTMLEMGQKDIEPTVVADQVGRPTFTSELVKAIDHLLIRGLTYGTYNVSNGGEPASWAEIAREIFKTAGYNLTVKDITTEDYYADRPEIAARPLNSTLSLDKLQSTGFTSTDWRQELRDYIAKETRK